MTTQRLLEKAAKAYKNKHYSDAENIYNHILESEPNRPDILQLLAALFLETNRAPESLRLLDTFFDNNPNLPDYYSLRGNVLHKLGRFAEAAQAQREAIKLLPKNNVSYYNLGNSLRMMGDAIGATQAYTYSIKLNPTLPQPYSNLSVILSEMGLFLDAEWYARKATQISPNYAEAHYNLGNALREQGQYLDAIRAYSNALKFKPEHCDALCNMGLTQFTDSIWKAADTLESVIQNDPQHNLARFYLGVALDELGQAEKAAQILSGLDQNDVIDGARLRSWDYIKKRRTQETKMLGNPHDTLRFALASSSTEGLICEFGVRRGFSIQFIAGLTKQRVHGFDSFLGLPEGWDKEAEGAYSTDGQPPSVPSNVQLHVGLFDEVLPIFYKNFEGPISFANIDCDLYSSTSSIFRILNTKIQSGTVLVFDEYLINPTWEKDEFKAFKEACKTYQWDHEYIGFCVVGKQAVVKIK